MLPHLRQRLLYQRKSVCQGFFCEPGKEPVVFSGGSEGTIATKLRGKDGRWHDFFYIPDGETRTLAEIGDEDQALKASYYGDAIEQFAKWYKAK